MKVAALFAGIAGIELGLAKHGHECALLCENDPSALAVLRDRLPGVPIHEDVQTLKELPSTVDLVTAGFPCQDLSQAGRTEGLAGKKSSLVSHVFRLLDEASPSWVFIENVPFMLQLSTGEAMEYLVAQLELRGYGWAYRVVNSRAFGLPQRRRRVFLLASKADAPEQMIFSEDAGPPCEEVAEEKACGFYWTEGLRGLGWAVDSVPTLKGGSSVGIPSPPAIWMPDGSIVTPSIRDAERLQGFSADWTKPAENRGRRSYRWRLVGNAVTVDAAAWIGRLLNQMQRRLTFNEQSLTRKKAWPSAAFGRNGRRWMVDCSEWPVRDQGTSLEDFLLDELRPLSYRATAGFLGRLKRSSLRYPKRFLRDLETHLENMSEVTEGIEVVSASG